MKHKKRLLSFLLALCMVCTLIPVTAFAENQTERQQTQAGLPFTDVKPSAWYYDAVSYVYEHNLMAGTSTTIFEPETVMNRAMVVQILYNREGKPAVSGSASFQDVASNAWYYNAVQWASANNVASGIGSGLFNPNGKVTREQFAQFLYNYAGKPAVEGTLDFPDAAQTSGWAVSAMTWATQNKLINGSKQPNGQLLLNPTGQTTRAQAASILRGFCENITINLEPYSITDLTVSGQTVTAIVNAPRTCTLQVKFLNENTEADLGISATAEVSAGLEQAEVKATTTKLLPTHFIAEVSLVDGNGKQLCSKFTCIKYTTNYEKFEAQTVDDFADETVINFDDDKTDNFGVLSDTVKEPSAASGKNIISENANDTYTVTNIDDTVTALHPGDEVLFYDADGKEVLVSIGTIKISGTTATITRNEDATLEDYYQVLKVDMSVAADPEDIDMSQADAGVTLLNENAKQSNSDSAARSDEKGIEIIDENIDLCRSLEFGLDYETKHFKTGGKLELKEMISVEISYDAVLFGEDYLYCKMQSETKGSFSFEVKAKVDNDDSVKKQKDEATIKLGKIPFPLGYGFSCSVSLTVPVEISLEGGAAMEASYSMKSGFTYSTKDGRQNISNKSFDVTFIQAEAKFEVKAGPNLASSIEFLKDVLKGEISGQAGGAFEAEAKTGSVGITDAESVHACALCVDGDVYLFANAKAKLSYQITKHLKGTPFSITLYEIKRHLSTFYVSVINEEDSPLKGQLTFGKGSCPNQQYRTTFHVKNTAGTEISGTQVSVKKGDTTVGTVETGKILYLYNGSYNAASEVNSKKLSKDFKVKSKASTVTLSEKTDVVTDPDNPDVPDPDPADVVASGTCGDNLTWTLDQNGTLTIRGTGKMYDWSDESDVPWYQLQNQIIEVDIGNSVTSIGNCAFYSCDSLTSVTIGNGVTSIGNYAFYDCHSLTSVTIPDSVTTMGKHTFQGCSSLESVTIPDSVTSIGYNAFSDCGSLTSVTIPDSVTSIGSSAFYGCGSLTSVTIPDTVTSIGSWAFAYCDSLTSVTIPDSVTSIGNYAFEGCDNLTGIHVDTNNPAYASVDGVLFNKNKTLLIQYPGGKSGAYTIPDSVTSIGDYAFYSCDSLTSVAIPDSVTSIGAGVFQYCNSLTSVTIGTGVTNIGDSAFSDCNSLTDVYYRGSEAQWAAITIGRYNDPLTSATIHYNS
ncbi:MAG: leucine-rich repeat protein [Clostridiales bacterium]|nr:leucine-rich repeat protein [Clostridiales bacterium]